jgi:protein subunit release factor A
MAKAETEQLRIQRLELGSKLVMALLKQSAAKSNDNSKKSVIEGAIVEVRAGTGGDEAGYFASELFDMVFVFNCLQNKFTWLFVFSFFFV